MLVLNKGLDGFFHGLMPSKLRETLAVNTHEYMRARGLSAMLVTLTILGFSATTFLITKHFIFNPELLKHDLISVAVAMLFSLQAVCYYRFNNYWISALVFTNSYFLTIVVLLVLGGGFDSSIKMLLLTCPLVSFVIGGMQEGIQNAIFTIIVGLTMTFFKFIGFDLPNRLSGENIYVDFALHWTLAVLIIVACAIVYDSEVQKHS